MNNKSLNFLQLLSRNGWQYIFKDSDLDSFRINILSDMYHTDLEIAVATSKKQLDFNGCFGVAYIDVCGYENDYPLGYEEIVDMQKAIEYAEDNLLAIGCPFSSTYNFHGKRVYYKKCKNNNLRNKYNLFAIELKEQK